MHREDEAKYEECAADDEVGFTIEAEPSAVGDRAASSAKHVDEADDADQRCVFDRLDESVDNRG